MTNQEQITRLTDFWYKYVSKDHHKDRDCHWYIEQVWSYGDEPKWNAHHYGYIFDEPKYREIECKNYEEAVENLLDMVSRAINNEKQWARKVLENPKEWDKYQIESAKFISDFEL